MKKLLLLTLTAMVLNTQAATISWGLGADVYLVKAGEDPTSGVIAYDDAAPAVDANAYLALVYIGQNKTSFDISDISIKDDIVDTMAFGIDTDNETYCDYDPYAKDTDVFAPAFSDNASFAVVWFNGKSLDYVYSATDGSAINSGDAVTTIAEIARGTGEIYIASNAGGGVLVVPEPSVALLGLLGIGMLIKRRRA